MTESRIEKRKKEQESGGDGDDSAMWSYIALGGVAVLVLVIAYFLFFSGGAAAEVEPWDDVTGLEGAEHPTMVAADATEEEAEEMVEVVYYGDYGCPFCAQFDRTNMHDIKDDYIATGDVRFVYRAVDFTDGENSRNTAVADRAVWEQNESAYWLWHRTTFANHGQGQRWGSADEIESWTAEIDGLDAAAVRQSVEDGEYIAQVQSNVQSYQSVNAQGTPSLYINGSVVNPLNDYDRVEELIQEEME